MSRPTAPIAVSLLTTLIAILLPAAPASSTHGTHPTSDITFPVAGPVAYGDDWHSPRGSRGEHRGQDLVGRRLQRIHAAMGGTVCDFAAVERGLGGWELAICGDDGRRYAYSHFNDDTPGTDDGRGGIGWAYAPGIAAGARVERGQWLGFMGDSGNAEAEAPQLHFHIQTSLTDPETVPYRLERLDPAPSLRAAQQRGDVPAVVSAAEQRRVKGATRLDTSAAISRDTRATATSVVLAPALTPHEALLAAPLAAVLDAPVLLADPDGLAPAVAAEVARLGAQRATLIGRPDQLGPGVVADLAAAGVTAIDRIEAADPLTLSVTVADRIAALTGASTPRVLLARGLAEDPSRTWPDAMSASTLAARLRAPILLTSSDTLAAPVRAFLERTRPSRLDVIGGGQAISEATASAARTASGASGERLQGATRYGTSAAVADRVLDLPAVSTASGRGTTWVATGRNLPDALTAGAAAAARGSALVLIDGDVPGGGGETSLWLRGHASDLGAIVVVGGPAAVSDSSARLTAELAAS